MSSRPQMAGPVVMDYPVQLALGYLFLGGYLARVLCLKVRMPPAVGVMMVGFVFSCFMQRDVYENRDTYQNLAFFLVLLNAGFEISWRQLPKKRLLIVFLPAIFELIGIAAYARWVLGWHWIQAAVLGNVCFPLGEGLVIPKLLAYKRLMPKSYPVCTVLTWAPMEATFSLTLFGFLAGLAGAANQPSISFGTLALASLIQLSATVAVAAFMGWALAQALSRIKASVGFADLMTPHFATPQEGRQQADHATQGGCKGCCARRAFNGTAVEAFLAVFGTALVGFGAAEMIPLGFASTGLFQPELFVIMFSSIFAHFADRWVLEGVEKFVASIWVFGRIILFSLLGSRTSLEVFASFPAVVPIMVVGVICRFLGVMFAGLIMHLTSHRKQLSLPGLLFCFLCSLPRATIQGALGTKPSQMSLFSGFSREDAHALQDFIGAAARLYIVCFSILGSVLLELCGPYLLRADQEAARTKQRGEETTSRLGSLANEGHGHLDVRAVASMEGGSLRFCRELSEEECDTRQDYRAAVHETEN